MKNYILGALMCLSSFSLYAIKEPDYYVRRDAQLFTEGDYGLELDWGKNVKGFYVCESVMDKENNIYVIGQYPETTNLPNGVRLSNDYPHMERGVFVAKFNKKGDVEWVKNIASGNHVYGSNIYLAKNDSYLIVKAKFTPAVSPSLNPPYNIDYDDKTIYIADDKNFSFLMKIKCEDGALADYVKLDVGGKSDPQSEGFMELSVTDDGEIYLYTFIGESFVGLDTTRLKTTTRTHGGADAYFAKINADFSLAWDFAIGGDKHDVPWVPEAYYDEYYGYFYQMEEWTPCWMVKKEDTLIAKISVFSDGVDIDPDSEKETILNTKWNNDAAVVKYYIGNDKPELVDYKYGYANSWPHNLFMAGDGHLFSMDYEKIEGSEIWYDKYSSCYREVDSDMKSHKLDGYQYNLKSPYSLLSYSSSLNAISFDESSNMFIALTIPKGEDSINIQLSDTLFMKSAPLNRTTTKALVKYGKDENLKWGILWPFSLWAEYYNFDSEGGFYISGVGDIQGKDTTDVDPNPDNEFVMTATYGVFLRYVETYRVKSASTEYGKIITPDKLVRWGNSAEVSVVPDSGYEVDEVSTSRGEKLEKNANGKYIVENVTDVVTVNATFKKSSAVDDIYSSRVRIYPNPVEDLLTIESEGRLTDAVIYNAQGKEILSILENTINVDVNTLPAGIYTLKAKLDDITVVKQFIKK